MTQTEIKTLGIEKLSEQDRPTVPYRAELAGKVSVYKAAKTTGFPIEDVDFDEIMARQRYYYKEEVERMRDIYRKDLKKYKQLKPTSISCFTGSGTCTGVHNGKHMSSYSGRIIIDFDGISESALSATKKKLSEDAYTNYVFVSLSGSNLAVAVKIRPESQVRSSFYWLRDYYKSKYGLVADESCKNPSRLRYNSYDPDIYWNKDSKPLQVKSESVMDDREMYGICFQNAEKTCSPGYVAGNRHRVLMVLAAFCNNAGIELQTAISMAISDLATEDMPELEIKNVFKWNYDRKSESFGTFKYTKNRNAQGEMLPEVKAIYAKAHELNSDGINWTRAHVDELSQKELVDVSVIESIFRFVFKENEADFGINHKPEIFKVEAFIRKNYELKRNGVTGIVDFRPLDRSELTDFNPDTIYRKLQHAGFKYPLKKLESLLKSDFVEEYNPIEDYFLSLPKRQGTQTMEKMASYINCEHNDFFTKMYIKFLVRCVACSLGRYVNRFVFVIIGQKQETGKSTWIRYHNPFPQGRYYCETPIRDDRDTEVRYSENMIYNLEELNALGSHDINKLKDIISRHYGKERKAYARNDKSLIRRANFFGSSNRMDFLTDTENSRWLSFVIKGINWDYSKEINIHEVWAEAYTLYTTHGIEHFELTEDEKKKRDEINHDLHVSSDEMNMLPIYFEPGKPTDGDFMNSTQICAYIKDKNHNIDRLKNMLMGKALTHHGFERVKHKGLFGYWVRYLLDKNEMPPVSRIGKNDSFKRNDDKEEELFF